MGPEFPHELYPQWSAFLDLSRTRDSGMGGPSPISYTEIKNWSELTDIPIRPWEVEILKGLDQVYLRVANG